MVPNKNHSQALQKLTVAGNQMNVFLNENWRDIYKELSPALITAFTEIITAILEGIAGSVPFDVAFPEKLPSA
jgi:hypothetical protein